MSGPLDYLLTPAKRGPLGTLWGLGEPAPIRDEDEYIERDPLHTRTVGATPDAREVAARRAAAKAAKGVTFHGEDADAPAQQRPSAMQVAARAAQAAADQGGEGEPSAARKAAMAAVASGPRFMRPLEQQRNQAPWAKDVGVPNDMPAPDWSRQPEGEPELEQFYYEQMRRNVGSPRFGAFAQGFENIQQRKQARINALADHRADLIKQKFTYDLARRNRQDNILSDREESYLGRIFEAQAHAADYNQRERIAHLNRQLQMGRIDAETAKGKIENTLNERKFMHKVFSEVGPTMDAISQGQMAVNELTGLLGDEVWTGRLSAPGRSALQWLDLNADTDKAERLIAQLELQMGQMQRDGRLSDKDAERIKRAVGNLNQPLDAWVSNLRQAGDLLDRRMTSTLDQLQLVQPQVADNMRKHYEDLQRQSRKVLMGNAAREGVRLRRFEEEEREFVRGGQ